MYRFPNKIFPNAINAYLLCPFKFKCHNDPDVKAEFVETPQSFSGSAIHLALKEFFDITKVPIDKRKVIDIGEILRDAWGKLAPKDKRKELFGSQEQERAFGLQAVSVLKNFLSSVDLSVVPLALEDWFDCPLSGFTIAGRIDRIDREDGKISVWDYKTGKLPFHQTIEDIIKEDLQIPIYAIIASKLNPLINEVRAGLIYLKFSKTYEACWNKEQLKGIEQTVVSAINKAKEDKALLPKPNKLCEWCEYKKVCPRS